MAIPFNDLTISTASEWKYVGDTNVVKILNKMESSTIQSDAELVLKWLSENRLQLNIGKCKEMTTDIKVVHYSKITIYPISEN